MPVESELDRLTVALDAALRAVLHPEEFDVTRGAAGDLDVSTDDWTLHVEGWPDGVAWLAIDDEPDDPADFVSARRAVMSEAVERALAAADRAVGGALTRALDASGDAFTLSFADALAVQWSVSNQSRSRYAREAVILQAKEVDP
jgi:hypothetical protein